MIFHDVWWDFSRIWSSKHLSCLGKSFAYFDFNSSTGWQLEAFLVFSSRWHYSTSFWFIFSALPCGYVWEPALPPSTPSARGVSTVLMACTTRVGVGGTARVTGSLASLCEKVGCHRDCHHCQGHQVSRSQPLLLRLTGLQDVSTVPGLCRLHHLH